METFVYPQTERYLGMALFIFYTTCAMMMRWVPGVKEVLIKQGTLISILFQFAGAFLDASNLFVGDLCLLVVCRHYLLRYLGSSASVFLEQ